MLDPTELDPIAEHAQLGGRDRRDLETERELLLSRRALHRRELERRRRRARVRRNRFVAASILAVLVTLSYFLLGTTADPRLADASSSIPAVVTSYLAKAVVVPGKAPVFSWPAKGQGAVAVLGVGPVAQSPGELVVPIASLTKMMTTYVILRDHPISLSNDGPALVMRPADVAAWVYSSQNDQSNTQVSSGEVLTERQLLEALLLPSADNIANTLAIWDSGSIAAFVAKMNAAAKALGLSMTHYADASGLDPASRSDAADQALLASQLMRDPLVRSIVSQKLLAFPVAGTIRNVNPALGVDGIVGVKSGYTSKALGCLATAGYQVVGGKSVLVVVVSLGQPDGLYGAARVDEGLLSATRRALVSYRPVRVGRRLGTIDPAGAPRAAVVLGERAPVIVGWPGLRVSQQLLAAAHPRPSRVGTIVYSTPFGLLASAKLVDVNLGLSSSTTSSTTSSSLASAN